MGAWGSGPFDSDTACDFLASLGHRSQATISKALHHAARVPPGEPLDVDDAVHAWVAAEIVAGAFGQLDPSALNDTALRTSTATKPDEKTRLLAIDAAERIRGEGELRDLFQEAEPKHRRDFEARLSGLLERLRLGVQGAVPLKKAKRGELLLLPGVGGRALVQVLGANEVVVFEASFDADAPLLDELEALVAHRVVAGVALLARVSDHLGPASIRAEHKSKAHYAQEAGCGPNGGYFDNYSVASASGGNLELVGYEEAKNFESGAWYEFGELQKLAQSPAAKKHVYSPEQREAAVREAAEPRWLVRRQVSRPGVFGDVEFAREFLEWMESTGGVPNLLRVFRTGGLPGALNERNARYGQLFCALVAWWLGRWSLEALPGETASRFPPPPDPQALAAAVRDAAQIADRLLDRDSVLRLMWCGDAAGIKELEDEVMKLQCALTYEQALIP